MAYVPVTPFEKFCYYHGRCKAFLNKPKVENGETKYLTADAATLLGCYLNVSNLLENMNINNFFINLCAAAAKEAAKRFNVPISDAFQTIHRQALNKNY